jgi:hypothetical protein
MYSIVNRLIQQHKWTTIHFSHTPHVSADNFGHHQAILQKYKIQKSNKTEEEEEEKLHQLGHELFCDTIHS